MQHETQTPPPIVQDIIEFIGKTYAPCDDYLKADVRASTMGLYQNLQLQFPSVDYTEADVFQWLKDMDFTYISTGAMQIEWMLKKK